MIKLPNIEKIYYSSSKPLYALRNINLDINQGEIFGKWVKVVLVKVR